MNPINEFYMFIVKDKDGNERILSTQITNIHIPLIGMNAKEAESLKPMA